MHVGLALLTNIKVNPRILLLTERARHGHELLMEPKIGSKRHKDESARAADGVQYPVQYCMIPWCDGPYLLKLVEH